MATICVNCLSGQIDLSFRAAVADNVAVHHRFPWAILFAVLASTASGSADELSRSGVTVARFAVIYPEADQAREEQALTADAGWLRLPRKTNGKTNSPSGTKPGKAIRRSSEKSEAGVVPLKRDRPRKETDPPKTRRPQLGW